MGEGDGDGGTIQREGNRKRKKRIVVDQVSFEWMFLLADCVPCGSLTPATVRLAARTANALAVSWGNWRYEAALMVRD